MQTQVLRQSLLAAVALVLGGCSCCPEDPSSSDPQAAIVTVSDLPEFSIPPGTLYVTFVLEDVAFTIEPGSGKWGEICICGYGKKPGTVVMGYLYSGGSGTYRDELIGSYTTTEYTYCWQVKASLPVIAVLGDTIDEKTGIDWAKPSGVIFSIPGVDDADDLDDYGPVRFYID